MNMQLPKPIQHELIQGSDEWHSFRLEHFGSSEAAAMLGLTKLCSRDALLHAKATGDVKEYSAFVQERIFDHGHEVETMARRIISERIGEILSPEVWSFGLLSASIDGVTLDGETAFEHKQYNMLLATSIASGILPDEYMPQPQQIMMVRGCKKVIFVCSDGTEENMVSMEVYPDSAWQKRIALGWRQFKADLATYTPPIAKVEYIGKPPEQLPALHIEATGMVTASNLVVFKEQALAVFAGIKKELVTDEDFANAKATMKWCEGIEEKLEQAEEKILNGSISIADAVQTIRALKEESRRTRLNLNKQYETQETKQKNDMLAKGKREIADYIKAINDVFGKAFMPDIPNKFLDVVKNKRTLATRQSAINDEVARLKIEADQIAAKLKINLKTLQDMTADHKTLFLDAATLIHKNTDDLIALIRLRISDDDKRVADNAEKKRLEDERQAEAKKQAAASTVVIAQETTRQVTQQTTESLPERFHAGFIVPVAAMVFDKLSEPASSMQSKQAPSSIYDELNNNLKLFSEFYKTERDVLKRMFEAGDIEGIARIGYIAGFTDGYSESTGDCLVQVPQK